MQVKGFINVFKPLNMTSSDVVVKVRGMLRRATGEKQKVGHLGTLDPLAVGVLPIAVGNATRLFDYMQDKKKTYIATFRFGATTDTLDRGGKIIETCDRKVGECEVTEILPNLIGEISQIPPQYSAKNVNGKKAYVIAREGGIADLKPKKVNIYSIKLLGALGENIRLLQAAFTDNAVTPMQSDLTADASCVDCALSDNEFAFEIVCGSGTYIRAIARDMAKMLNTVGYMTSLCRTQTGDFTIDSAVTLDELQSAPLDYILPINTALKSYDTLDLDGGTGNKALNGIKVDCDKSLKSPIAVSVCGKLVGLGENDGGILRLTTRL